MLPRNIPSDQDIIDAVNEAARQLVNAEIPPGEMPLPERWRCDMSRVGFIRRRWERAVEAYKQETGLDPIESLARIEAELRGPAAAPALHVERT
jgi:hypothetical protein